MTEYIKFPSGDDLDHMVDKFKTKWGVPQRFGVIDDVTSLFVLQATQLERLIFKDC